MKTLIIFAAFLLVVVVSVEGKTFELVPLKIFGRKPSNVLVAKADNDDPDDPKPEGRFFVEILAALKGALVGGGIGGLAGAALSNANFTLPGEGTNGSTGNGSGAQCIIIGGRSLDLEKDQHHVQFIQRGGEARQTTTATTPTTTGTTPTGGAAGSTNANCIIVTKKKPESSSSFAFPSFFSFMPQMRRRNNPRRH